MRLNDIRARDYHPAFSSVLLDHWMRFDPEETGRALDALAAAHPDCNAVRIHHSYDAYLRDPRAYLARWETLLGLCASRSLGVIAVLFNRWHDRRLDCGGIYLENLVPGLSWAYREGFYAPYLADVCGGHARDGRVVLWETCDKPFGAYADFSLDRCDNYLYESRWLREIYCYVKQLEPSAPAAVSVRPWYDAELMEALELCCDVLVRSPCYMNPEGTEAILTAALPESRLPVLTVREAF